MYCNMLNKSRCLTTIIDNEGISKLNETREPEIFVPYELFPCFKVQELFYTEDSPQSLMTRHLQKKYDIDLLPGAMRFLKLRMPTKKEMTDELIQAGQAVPDDWTKFNLHRTDTIDYMYVLSGKITSITGNDSIELQEGDFLSQVGTEHTWINDNDEPCILLCFIIGLNQSGAKKKMVVE